MLRLGGFWKRGSEVPGVKPEDLARIRDLTRGILALPEDATVAANEIVCADPACPGSETVILVMVPGQRTKAYKVLKTAADTGEDDLRAAFSGSATPTNA
jgi:hypothetical protein